MFIASYHDFGVKAVKKAIEILNQGGNAIDAVEKGINEIENDPTNTSVGLSGWPNWLGEVELDAGIMDGKTLKACGVGAVKNIQNPITLARKCLEELPHTLIVGESAIMLAKFFGIKVAKKRPATSLIKHKKKEIERKLEKGDIDLRQYYKKIFSLAPKIWHDTIGIIVIDKNNNIAAGASTSGAAFKFPGRVGDSAIVGAGFYADNRYGAAICTGVGEVAMRSLAAFRAVYLLSKNYNPQEAAEITIKRTLEVSKNDKEKYSLGIVVVSKEKEIGAAALNWQNFKYVYWSGKEIKVLSSYNIEM